MSRRFWILAWSSAGLLGGLALLLFAWGGASLPGGGGICLSARLGLACPGCGLTRSIVALIQGDLGASISYHPLGPVIAVQIGIAWGYWGACLAGWVEAPSGGWLQRVIFVQLAALLVIWIGRAATGTLPV